MNTFEKSQPCHEPGGVPTNGKALAVAGQLCAQYENENAHTDHVTRLALQLFDATHRWLGMTGEDRTLLEMAGRLHDVAYRLDPIHYRERSAEIACREGSEAFSADQCACIAAIILFHDGNWKDQLDHPMMKRLREPHQARRLGAFLRIADGLDWGHVQDAAIVEVRKSPKLVRVRVASDWLPINVARADHQADLWRAVFPLDIRFVLAPPRRPHPMVEPGLHPIEVARRLLMVQYKTILANADDAVAGKDPEPLHRIRVAIRRLRSLLHAFRKHLPDTGPLVEALGSLGSALGAARDLDVWVAFLHSDEVTRVLQSNRRWRAFLQHHEQVRRLQLPTVRRELRGARFNALGRRMEKLLRTQLPPLLNAGTMTPLEKLAVKKFDKELRRVRDAGRPRRDRSPEKLHRLRVALRRARYLGEFFGPVLWKSASKLTRRLHQVETPLAQIHDLDVELSLIQQSGPASPRAFSDLLATRREQQWSTVELAWRRFAELEKKMRR